MDAVISRDIHALFQRFHQVWRPCTCSEDDLVTSEGPSIGSAYASQLVPITQQLGHFSYLLLHASLDGLAHQGRNGRRSINPPCTGVRICLVIPTCVDSGEYAA